MPDQLIKGFEEFCAQEYTHKDGRMRELVSKGQNPDHFIISCIDSRADPSIVLKTPPGKYFGFKPMGAIVRPYVKGTALAAGLQFGLTQMNIEFLVILGHTQCGAIQALIEENDDPEISSFMDVAKSALITAKSNLSDDHTQEELSREAERQVVLQSMANLRTYPSVRRAEEKNGLKIKGWIFDMKEGALLEYSSQTDQFEKISPIATNDEACCG